MKGAIAPILSRMTSLVGPPLGFFGEAMPPLDHLRLTYALAGALGGEVWTPAGMRSAMRRVYMDRRVPTLGNIARLLKAFPARPGFAELAAWLRATPGFFRGTRAIADFGRTRNSAAEAQPRGLRALELPVVPTIGALASWLGLPLPWLFWLADPTGRNRLHPKGPLRTYRYRWIPRAAGPPRILEIPKARLKEIQRIILAEILNAVPAHPAAHGFRPGHSIVTNAAMHCGKAVVLRFDLTDFFPSVTSARIFRIFRTLGYPPRVAQLLTGFCTTRLPAAVWEGRPGARDGADFDLRQRLISRHLPQGAPTSPALANLAAHRLDRRLSGLARAAGAEYTRYADDLTFSGAASLARGHIRFQAQVAAIASEEGFTLNHRKTRLMRAGNRQRVTGVIVNARPNITRADYDNLKATLTNCIRHGPATQNRDKLPDFRATLAGKIAHVASIHFQRGHKLRQLFDAIQWEKTPRKTRRHK